MKLFAAALLVAAVSVTGCATDDGSDGQYLSGLRPAKPSFDTSAEAQHPDVTGSGLQLTGLIDVSKGRVANPMAITISDGSYPLPGKICDGCDVTLVTVDTKETSSSFGIGDVDVVKDDGQLLCRLHQDLDGGWDTSECAALAAN